MPSLFWSGRLTVPMKLLIEANNLLCLVTGSSGDLSGMKDRVKRGYEGEFSDHVHSYDALGFHLQDRSARIQLEGLDFDGMNVLDVGCGTGALAYVAVEQGARSVVCGDVSYLMLKAVAAKNASSEFRLSNCQLDAEGLPFSGDSFDSVLSGMTFGTLPDQALAVREMIRVTKPGGLVCVGAHGPEHYWEAIDATLRCINKRHVLGYRFEWWPRTEAYMRTLLEGAGLEGVQSKRATWRNKFQDGGAAYDFFAAISSSWWYAKFPQEERDKDSRRTRDYFIRREIDVITDDIVVVFGRKCAASHGLHEEPRV
jgi:ubiquinone/menaquinone biosynthesis C-methylase UbiE